MDMDETCRLGGAKATALIPQPLICGKYKNMTKNVTAISALDEVAVEASWALEDLSNDISVLVG